MKSPVIGDALHRCRGSRVLTCPVRFAVGCRCGRMKDSVRPRRHPFWIPRSRTCGWCLKKDFLARESDFTYAEDWNRHMMRVIESH